MRLYRKLLLNDKPSLFLLIAFKAMATGMEIKKGQEDKGVKGVLNMSVNIDTHTRQINYQKDD